MGYFSTTPLRHPQLAQGERGDLPGGCLVKGCGVISLTVGMTQSRGAVGGEDNSGHINTNFSTIKLVATITTTRTHLTPLLMTSPEPK